MDNLKEIDISIKTKTHIKYIVKNKKKDYTKYINKIKRWKYG